MADHLLPARSDQGRLAEIVREDGSAVAAQPDIGLAGAVRRQDQQQAAGDFRGLTAAQVGAGFQPRPLMTATALAAGIHHEWRQAFFGQCLHARHGGVFFTQRLDLVEGHPQVGVQALLGSGEVAAGVNLVAGDGLFVFALATQQHHTGGEHHDQQVGQQHVQGFVPGAGRANHLSAAHGWAISA